VTKNDLKDGILGLKNNSLYCYMNACLQCLIPIVELRDYFIKNEFNRFANTQTMSNSNDYCRSFNEFYEEVYKIEGKSETYLNPTKLKNLIRRKFYPMM